MMQKRNITLGALLSICTFIFIIKIFKWNTNLLQESKLHSKVYLEIPTSALEDEESTSYAEKDDASKEELIKVLMRNRSLSCPCKNVSLPGLETYHQQFKKNLEWLNLTTMEHLAKHHPNFPTTIMPSLFKRRCHLLPPPHSISWSSYWQVANGEKTRFLLYSAFIDNRQLTVDRPVVRIIANTRSVVPEAPWCYLWFNASGPPVVSSIKLEYYYMKEPSDSHLNTFFLVCRVPRKEAHRKPLAVSVVENPCMPADNLLEVIGSLERNNATAYREGKSPLDDDGTGFSVAACGTELFYYQDDVSIRLVEWFEILRAIGFSKVFFHETDVHPNISKVLQYYEKDGLAGVTKYNLPDPYMNEPSLRWLWTHTEGQSTVTNRRVFFSDCILRHMHEYRFIAHIDPDEIPMMLKHDSYVSWMDDIVKRATAESTKMKKSMPASYEYKWRWHYDDLPISEANKDLPEYLWVLRHSKSLDPRGKNHKSLYDMNTVISVNAHNPEYCTSGKIFHINQVLPSEIYMGHYKDQCGRKCQNTVTVKEVNYLLQYKDQIEKAVTKVLKELKLI